MYDLLAKAWVLIFCLIAGGAALASAGEIMGIPMMLLGIYLAYKGWLIFKNEELQKLRPHLDKPSQSPDTPHLIKLGILLLLTLIIGIWLYEAAQ